MLPSLPLKTAALYLLFLTLGLAAQQTGAPAPVTARKAFQISGIVVHAQTGEPLALTQISIGSASGRDPFPDLQSVVTGEDGRFLFKNLSPGKYALVAERKGFPRQAFNQHEYFSSAIAVGPDKISENLVFRLLPEGSISGKISDQEGDPVQNCQVMLFEKRVENGEQGTFMRTQAQTDDQGLYHFGHLHSGTYFVVASAQPWYTRYSAHTVQAPSNENSGSQANNGNAELDRAFPLTYYPAANEPDGASPIAIEPGSPLTADITLSAVPALHLHLTNVSLDSSQNVQVTLTQSVFGNSGFYVNAQTNRRNPDVFEVTGIAPGHYDINLQISSPDKDNKNTTPSSRHQTATLLRDGEIDATKGSESALVSGIVEFEGFANPPVGASIQLHNRESVQGHGNRILSDGKFEPVVLPPGRYEVFVPNAGGFFVKSIAADGAKVYGHTIEIKDPGSIQLAVVVSKGVGVIEGVVLHNDKPTAGAMVVLVPQDPANNLRLFRRDQSDSDGTFILRDVLPGKYTLLAIENGWDLEWANPTVLQHYMSKGETVQVESKGKYNVAVKLQ